MNTQTPEANHEIEVRVQNGWLMLPFCLALLLGSIPLLIYSIAAGNGGPPVWGLFVLAVLMFPTSIILLNGLFTLQPNEARVLILFGSYKGTVREDGFHWGNLFSSNGPRKYELATRTAESQTKSATTKDA